LGGIANASRPNLKAVVISQNKGSMKKIITRIMAIFLAAVSRAEGFITAVVPRP
jgi:hypothetical protein